MSTLRCVGCDKELELVSRRDARTALPCCGERECKNVMKRRWNKERSVFALARVRDRKFLEACERFAAGHLLAGELGEAVRSAQERYEIAAEDLQP